MRHFRQLDPAAVERLFAVPPVEFSRRSEPAVLAQALGATLYMPATRATLATDLRRRAAEGLTSAVLCLEDAVADDRVDEAEANVVAVLRALAEAGDAEEAVPLLFVRVRRADQIPAMTDRLGASANLLSGFVLPKFTRRTGPAYLDALAEARGRSGVPLTAMPVLESPEVSHRETRVPELAGIRGLLQASRHLVLAVRVGATDLGAVHGLRRDPDLTVWDVRVVADVLADVVNVLGRADGTGWPVSGPVWEHFQSHDRLLKPQLRTTPFQEHHAARLRHRLVLADLDGLIREVLLDRANGMTGKTVIHPTHIAAVHALSVVTHEEYGDARDLLSDGMAMGGVRGSVYGGRMNESKPHRAWAARTLRRAAAFGVLAEGVGFVDLLTESLSG